MVKIHDGFDVVTTKDKLRWDKLGDLECLSVSSSSWVLTNFNKISVRLLLLKS